jgi:hypothetical protein
MVLMMIDDDLGKQAGCDFRPFFDANSLKFGCEKMRNRTNF